MKADDGAVSRQLLVDVRISTDAVSKCAAWRCAVVLRLDRVVHGKRLGLHRRCSERLKYEGVATSLSGVLPEERCKVGSADDDGGGVYVGHERCGGRSWRRDGCQHDCEGVTQRCFRWFWKEQRLRVRVLVLRERVMPNIRMSQDADCPQHGTVEGFEDGRQQRKEREKAQVQMSRVRQVWLGHECQGSERVRSKQESLGRDDIRRLRWLEIGSLSLPDRNREFQNGIESYAAVMVFALLGVKSCKSCLDLSARKVIGKLRRESENVRDVHSFDGSVRDEPHEPRCVLPLLLQGYRVFRTVLGRLARTAIRFVLTFGAEQIEDLTITIANSVYTRCVRRARQWALQKECR